MNATFHPIQAYTSIIPKKKVDAYVKQNTYNEYVVKDTEQQERTCFKKVIPLIDFVKYLSGKYKQENILTLPCPDPSDETPFISCIQSPHNYAYVDSFFYCLTSNLKEAGFQHGMEVFDEYICLADNVEINIADDFEYICESQFFKERLNHDFFFKEEELNGLLQEKKQEPIHISDEHCLFELEDLELNEVNDKEVVSPLIEEIEEVIADEELVEDDSDGAVTEEVDFDLDDPEDGSELSFTDEEEEEEISIVSDCDTPELLQDMVLNIKKMPVQVVTLEKCENTLDSLLETDAMRMEELESAMFQIVVMLYTYQKIFHFTHNDLHTNNIMYVNTDKEFICYKVLGHTYKIPTFGKLYKIIDFGRAIYEVNGKRICSDSFSENGMAHTQYNCEPFFNPTKPVIEPNYSFDLCRLACSMLDFIIDDLKEMDHFREVPIYDLILSWLYDDHGMNILYKKNGEDRYPEFKLYKMIARIVHQHVPEKQFNHECFAKYRMNVDVDMDIDDLVEAKRFN
jgi:hypothetical protein